MKNKNLLFKIINSALGGIVGGGLGFVLFRLFYAVFGSTWSTSEGGPWLVVYSPYIVLEAVGIAVGFCKKLKAAVLSCIVTLVLFAVGGLVLMLVAGMFVGGGAIYVVAIVGVIAGIITAMNAIVK